MSQFDPDVVFPPDRFVRIRDVPVFDSHESDGSGGKPRKVTEDDLEKIAENCNRKFDELGVATTLTLGHTRDDPRTPEWEQPKPIGWACRFRVGDLLKTGRKALFCDWFVRKQHADVIDDYPHRSVEWWQSRGDLNPISLLRTAPERDLPIIKYAQEPTDEVPYRYTFTPPNPQSPPMIDDPKKILTDAVAGETAGAKKSDADIADLKSQVAEIKQFLQQLLQMVETDEDGDDGGADDLLGPADDYDGGDGDETEPEKKPTKNADKPKKIDADEDEEPEKYGAEFASAGDVFTPTTDTEKKTKMARNTDDRADYQRAVEEIKQTLLRENADLRVAYNRNRAEKAVAELESKHRVDFGGDEGREDETKFLTDLLGVDRSAKSFDAHVSKIAVKYAKKPEPTPDAAGVDRALRYARTGDPKPTFAGQADIDAFLKARAASPGLTPEQWASQNGK